MGDWAEWWQNERWSKASWGSHWTEENKLIYTTIHNEYMQLIEMWIEGRMVQMIPCFSMESFLPELNEFIQSGAADRGDAKKVVDLLNSWADFPSFKEKMLDASKLVFFAIE